MLMSQPFIQAVLEGERDKAAAILDARIADHWPDEEDRWLLRLRSEQIQQQPDSALWLVRAIVRRADHRMLGHIGFHGPPDKGMLEIGYTILEEHRRMGFASEAVRGLFEWAHTRHGIERFRASVAPDNYPSLELIKKFGFVEVGVQWDERDGQELVFEASYPQPAG